MSTEIPPSIHEIFGRYDNGTGFLDKVDLERFLGDNGVTDPVQRKVQTEELWKLMDTDGSGAINIKEFYNGIATQAAQRQQEQNLIDEDSQSESNPDYDEFNSEESEEEFEEELMEVTSPSKKGMMRRGLKAFRAIDVDGDGELDRKELALVLQKLGVSNDALSEITGMLMQKLDTDNDGTVSMDEFIDAIKRGDIDTLIEGAEELQSDNESDNGDHHHDIFSLANTQKKPPSSRLEPPPRSEKTENMSESKFRYLWDLFCVADDDHSGNISEDELYELMNDPTLFSEVSSRSLIHSIMESIDIDGDGTLDFEEFCDAFDQMFDTGHNQNRGILDAKTKALSRENTDLKQRLGEYKKRLKETENIRLNEATKQELESELAALHHDLSHEREQLQQYRATNSELQEQMGALKRENERLKEKFSNANGEERNEGASDKDEIIKGYKEEIMELQAMYKQETHHYTIQGAIAEVQLEGYGDALVMEEYMETMEGGNSSFYDRLTKEEQEHVDSLVGMQTRKPGKGLLGNDKSSADAGKIAQLQQDKEELQTVLRELMQRKEEERQALEASHFKSEKEWQESMQKLEAQVAQAQSQVQAQQSSRDDNGEIAEEAHLAEVAKLKAQHAIGIQEEKKVAESLQEKVDGLHTQLMELRSQHIDDHALAEKEDEINKLNSRLTTSFLDRKKLVDEKAAVLKERDDLAHKLDHMTKKMQQHQQAQKEQQMAVNELESALAALRDESEGGKEGGDSDDEVHLSLIAALENDVVALRGENMSLRERVAEMEKGEKLMEEMSANNQELVASLSDELERVKERCRCATLETHIRDLEEKLTTSNANLKQLKRDLATAQNYHRSAFDEGLEKVSLEKSEVVVPDSFDVPSEFDEAIGTMMNMINLRTRQIELLAEGKEIEPVFAPEFGGRIDNFSIDKKIHCDNAVPVSGKERVSRRGRMHYVTNYDLGNNSSNNDDNFDSRSDNDEDEAALIVLPRNSVERRSMQSRGHEGGEADDDDDDAPTIVNIDDHVRKIQRTKSSLQPSSSQSEPQQQSNNSRHRFLLGKGWRTSAVLQRFSRKKRSQNRNRN
eukprot:m.139599 g.139599  ORF g.139599 m.139599 type:complete len:1074 (+) comp13172_c0_seq1:77-3298(+)